MYERFFGLSDAPFRLTPDPRYLFLSRRHADALAHLRLGLQESGFVCITGDVGTGKTTLLRAFLAQLGPEIDAAYVFNPALSPLELVKTITAEFGLPAAGKSSSELFEQLNRHLLAQKEAGRRCVVIVDEAQALGIEVLEQLRLLSNLETTTEKLLRIILVGQPQLRLLLMHPDLVQLNQRITLRWHIGPLRRSETAAYVRHRLAVASDGQAGRVFTTPALALVHRVSGGVPRLTNMLCHRALLAAFASDRKVVRRATVRRAYRELANVPLPMGRRSRRRLAWMGVGVATLAAAITLGAREITSGLLTAAVPAPAPAAPVAAVDPPPPTPPASVAAVAPIDPVPEVHAAQAAPPSTLEAKLAALDPAESARGALGVLLTSWRTPRLTARETVASPNDFPKPARRRKLDALPISGNLGMLRLLDAPAILEIQPTDADGPRWVTLVGVDETGARLSIGGTIETMPAAELQRIWLGRAWVFWRDFEGLGPAAAFTPEASHAAVRRLQTLLRRAGTYDGPESGVFEDSTVAAVREFQRSRYLPPDGWLGPITRIALYAAAGGYQRPVLTATGGGTS